MRKKISLFYPLLILALLFWIVLYLVDPASGKVVSRNFFGSFLTMVKILPFTFILISLFEVWVKREKVEKHLGIEGGALSFLWALALGGTTVGPMIVAFPVASALFRKGARLSVIFTYIGASAVCRIPMTIFESSYLGVKFTIVRYTVSVPLVILTSVIMGRILEKKNFSITA